MTDYATRWGRDRTRVTKGHPLREQRRQRAAERLAAHVYDPSRCKPGCPKKLNAPSGRSTTAPSAPVRSAAGLDRHLGTSRGEPRQSGG